jgi:hypothetical protein
MAAKLNIYNGASSTPSVNAAISYAESFFGEYTPEEAAGLSKAARKIVQSYAGILGQYDEGLIGPGHCDEQNDVLSTTGQWSLSVNGGTYMHDMFIVTQNPDGSLTGAGGYPEIGPPYDIGYDWTLNGQLTGNLIEITVTYSNGYTATINGTVNALFDYMSGGAGTGGVTDWSATRI